METMNRYCVRASSANWILLLAGALLAAAPAGLAAQERIGTVRAAAYETRPVAVPLFEVQGGQALQQDLSEIVGNDLRLSGFFHLPTNSQFVNETHALDLKEGKVHYPEWRRVGVSYLVKGKYSIQGNRIEAEVRTYDIVSGVYMFGKKYPGYDVANPRYLAHRISNDIIQRITGFPGASDTQLVFVRDVNNPRGRGKEVFVMDADGHNIRQVTNDQNLAVTPTWGANGTEIYYTTYKDFNPDLAGIFLNGSHHWFVSRFPQLNISPDWNQRKGTIALTLGKDGNSEIYVMRRDGKGPDGKDPKRLTFNKSIDGSPSWSPNGDQMVFTSDRNGSPQLYIMDESGLNVRQLTRTGNYNDSGVWSPRGDLIAFASRINGVFQIFTISPTGENLQQLTNGPASNEDPAWSPNGWVLAYTSNVTGRKQIHTMFIDGRPIDRLTNGENCYSPDWSPMRP